MTKSECAISGGSVPVIHHAVAASRRSTGDIDVADAGHMPRKSEWIHHRFPLQAVGLVVAGTGTYQVGDGPVKRITAGQWFAVYPGAVFHYGPDPGTTWEEFFLCVKGPGLTRWLKRGLLLNDGGVHTAGDTAGHVNRWRELIATCARGYLSDADRAVAMAELLLIELSYAQAAALPDTSSAQMIDDVLLHCQKHLAQLIDFHELAVSHHMSYSSLRQLMRRKTGQSPSRYLTYLRCERAKQLLRESQLSVKEIAAQVGVDDPYAFSRMFRRVVGVSPRPYRQSIWP